MLLKKNRDFFESFDSDSIRLISTFVAFDSMFMFILIINWVSMYLMQDLVARLWIGLLGLELRWDQPKDLLIFMKIVSFFFFFLPSIFQGNYYIMMIKSNRVEIFLMNFGQNRIIGIWNRWPIIFFFFQTNPIFPFYCFLLN